MGKSGKGTNKHNDQDFITLPFNHPALANSVWGIGIKK